jgi:hypothetical protein
MAQGGGGMAGMPQQQGGMGPPGGGGNVQQMIMQHLFSQLQGQQGGQVAQGAQAQPGALGQMVNWSPPPITPTQVQAPQATSPYQINPAAFVSPTAAAQQYASGAEANPTVGGGE